MQPTIVIGAAGRMGSAIVRQVVQDEDLYLAAAIESPDSTHQGEDAAQVAGLAPCGVTITSDAVAAVGVNYAIIDFSAPDCTMAHIATSIQKNCYVVIGTTGFSPEQRAQIEETAAGGRVVMAPNMSVGINLLLALCGRVTPALGSDYDTEIVEAHHNRKKDAPSGTAHRLGEKIAEAKGVRYEDCVQHGREGQAGPRSGDEIGVHAVRGGDIVGEHHVIYATDGERIELTHKASSRQTFAKGAVRAVKFLLSADKGLYDMQDVLGLKDFA